MIGMLRILLPLPVTVSESVPLIGASRRLKAERFGDAQAAAVKKRQDGGVARHDPGLPIASRAEIGLRDGDGGG